ncbi:MAG: hypothetical protein IEMM0002_1554 [bacterium]|nr:MAG: hypothetical protein IEMM0002_1554 [bacterium]
MENILKYFRYAAMVTFMATIVVWWYACGEMVSEYDMPSGCENTGRSGCTPGVEVDNVPTGDSSGAGGGDSGGYGPIIP